MNCLPHRYRSQFSYVSRCNDCCNLNLRQIEEERKLSKSELMQGLSVETSPSGRCPVSRPSPLQIERSSVTPQPVQTNKTCSPPSGVFNLSYLQATIDSDDDDPFVVSPNAPPDVPKHMQFAATFAARQKAATDTLAGTISPPSLSRPLSPCASPAASAENSLTGSQVCDDYCS